MAHLKNTIRLRTSEIIIVLIITVDVLKDKIQEKVKQKFFKSN